MGKFVPSRSRICKRMKNFIIVATILFVGAVLIFTPFVAGGQSTTADDGIWRDCPISSKGLKIEGCYIANFIWPHLTSEERIFKEKLSLFASHPSGLTKSNLVQTFGREPDMAIEVVAGEEQYQWSNFGPGNDIGRGVVVRLTRGQLKVVRWISPKRFNLSYSIRTNK